MAGGCRSVACSSQRAARSVDETQPSQVRARNVCPCSLEEHLQAHAAFDVDVVERGQADVYAGDCRVLLAATSYYYDYYHYLYLWYYSSSTASTTNAAPVLRRN